MANIKRRRHPYYNFDKVYSHNAIINMVCGGRGIGKTYGAVVSRTNKYLKSAAKAAKESIEGGEQFVYLRRYKSETAASKATFFNAVQNEFPSHDFRITGNSMEMAPIETRDEKPRKWDIIGYFATLSIAHTLKGVSYHDVTCIIFDEFIIEEGQGTRYLKDEVKAFLEFFSTVDRYQDKTIALMLSNAVTIMNPYFAEWDIRPDQSNDGWVKGLGGELVAHFPDSEDFKRSIYDTRFGQLIKGTNYADYAVENTFKDNHTSLVEEKDKDARYLFTLENEAGMFSVWLNSFTDTWYCQGKQPKSPAILTMSPHLMSEEKTLVDKTDRRIIAIKMAFANGHMFFDTPRTRNTFSHLAVRR